MAWQRASVGIAASGKTHPVFREHTIGEVAELAQAGPASWGDQPSKTDGTVYPAKHLDALDPCAIRKACVDAIHQLGYGETERFGVEVRRSDIGEADALFLVAALEQGHLALAERAIAIVEDLDFVGMLHVQPPAHGM